MSFLSKLSALKKSTPVKHTLVITDKEKTPSQEIESLLPANYVRDEDPAVRRLKELRRKERIKNGELLKKRNAAGKKQSGSGDSRRSKKNKSQKDEDGGMLGTVYKRKIGSSTRAHNNNNNKVMKPRVPIKKMSFEELMRQAEQNDKFPMKSTSEPPTVGQSKKLIRPGFKSKSTRVNSISSKESLRGDRHKLSNTALDSKEVPTTLNGSKSSSSMERDIIKKSNNRSISSSGGGGGGGSSNSKDIVRIPSISANRLAQPNATLKQRLERKGYMSQSRRDRFGRQHNVRNDNYDEDEDVDSELDDFIEDDLDEEEPRYSSRSEDLGYDRDEIWAMFNKGRNKSHYYHDYEDEEEDDMEANEMEILDEEEYATRMAKLEDKKEEEWLRRHEEKKRRLKKKRE